MSQDGDTEKPHEPTPQKLEDARKKGDIVRSQDATFVLALAAFLVTLILLPQGILQRALVAAQVFWSKTIPASTPGNSLPTAGIRSFLKDFLFSGSLLFFVFPAVLILAALIASKRLVFTGNKLKPKLNRVSVLQNARKKLGLSGLVEFGKSVLKFLAYALLFWGVMQAMTGRFAQMVNLPPIAAIAMNYLDLRSYVIAVLTAALLVAILDILWQRFDHLKKNRMSTQELKDEHKETEGDAMIRQQRRARAEAIATNRMLRDVPEATVVIVNPTHYAVALKWDGRAGEVPKCVAKGVDETAMKIREIATEARVPLYRDPPTARILFAQIRIGQTIEKQHYKAVAVAIGFARKIARGKRR